jgi:hypothetical protein
MAGIAVQRNRTAAPIATLDVLLMHMTIDTHPNRGTLRPT